MNEPTLTTKLNWHDPMTAERFIEALSDALRSGQSHPQAIASARKAAQGRKLAANASAGLRRPQQMQTKAAPLHALPT